MIESLTEPLGVPTPIPVRTYVLWGLSLLVLVVVVGVVVQSAGTNTSGPPEPTAEMRDEMRMVDALEADGNCGALSGHRRIALTQLGAPGTDRHLEVATLVRYAEDALGRIGCQISADLTPRNESRVAGSSRTAAY